MLTREQEMMAQQLMQMNPGMSPQEAIQNVLNMSQGELGMENTRGLTPPPQGPEFGTVSGDIPIGTPMPGQTRAPGPVGTPGLLGPQGDFQPGGALQQREQLPQTPPKSVAQLCAESGGTLAGGMCHYSTPF